jgi:hypothetical protein
MNQDLATALGRLDRYVFRLKRAVRNGDLVVALADTAELAEVARRLWIRLESLTKTEAEIKERRIKRGLSPEDLEFVKTLPRGDVQEDMDMVKGDR